MGCINGYNETIRRLLPVKLAGTLVGVTVILERDSRKQYKVRVGGRNFRVSQEDGGLHVIIKGEKVEITDIKLVD